MRFPLLVSCCCVLSFVSFSLPMASANAPDAARLQALDERTAVAIVALGALPDAVPFAAGQLGARAGAPAVEPDLDQRAIDHRLVVGTPGGPGRPVRGPAEADRLGDRLP